MEFRKLGKSDLSVSLIGLGCNNFSGRIDLDIARSVIEKSLDLGINFFDTADVYGGKGGSEEYLGKILGSKRKEIILATKFAMPMDDSGLLSGASRKYIHKAIEASLRRLKTDWIDLYQVHRPDITIDPDETMLALDELVQQGKVRYIGCSNYSPKQLIDAQSVFINDDSKKFISCQDEYSLLVRDIEEELTNTFQSYEMGLLPYFPLASGLLTGKYKKNESLPDNSRFFAWPQLSDRYMTEHNWKKIHNLEKFCKRNNIKLVELAFSWLASKTFVSSIIAGATSPKQVSENVDTLHFKITESQLKEVDSIISNQK